ncbi:hypothetical protein B0T16DRAFT_450998 [Cercophora newfieldiana]|uniref:Uncharacterized protein n=1 Tax=Cercophora newfieldiana TaxID=92897 RepID=A0AA39YNV5_9PEZI|nr:hypothetical protein B0T16DRAFT_450998 [Cercophora newfieldiana]
MAIQQNRKRPRADDPPQEHRPSKKLRAEGRARSSSNFSPEFWDNLSKVWLTPRALRELDRRNDARPAPKPPSPAVYTTDLARFARRGGPDLRHLRGCPEPKGAGFQMASSSPSASSRRTKSTKATSISSKSGKSSAYGPEFETHLADHSIYPEGYEYPEDRSTPEPGNLVHQDLSAARASLSPSCFSASKFRDFKRKDARATFENDVMTTVIPIICGDADIPSRQNVLFTELAPVTSNYEDVVRPKPDLFDGANIGDLDGKVRDPKGDMYPLIIPIKHVSVPVAPNFFLEAKAPKGAADVLKRQACYDGAYGARAMHALQSYDEEEPAYDGNAYTYSLTYHAGTLKLYAHHVTAPTAPEGRPEYHMTQVDTWGMTGNMDSFRRGATAFRNARDLAKQHRDEFIQGANARARRSDALLVDEPEAEAQQYGDSGSDEFVECEEYVGSQAVAAENYAASQDVDEGSALPQYLYAADEDHSQASPSIDVVETSMSFAVSSTSSFSTQSEARPKRNKASHSPPSNPQPHKKQDLAKSPTRHSAPRRSARSSAASLNI